MVCFPALMHCISWSSFGAKPHSEFFLTSSMHQWTPPCCHHLTLMLFPLELGNLCRQSEQEHETAQWVCVCVLCQLCVERFFLWPIQLHVLCKMSDQTLAPLMDSFFASSFDSAVIFLGILGTALGSVWSTMFPHQLAQQVLFFVFWGSLLLTFLLFSSLIWHLLFSFQSGQHNWPANLWNTWRNWTTASAQTEHVRWNGLQLFCHAVDWIFSFGKIHLCDDPSTRSPMECKQPIPFPKQGLEKLMPLEAMHPELTFHFQTIHCTKFWLHCCVTEWVFIIFILSFHFSFSRWLSCSSQGWQHCHRHFFSLLQLQVWDPPKLFESGIACLQKFLQMLLHQPQVVVSNHTTNHAPQRFKWELWQLHSRNWAMSAQHCLVIVGILTTSLATTRCPNKIISSELHKHMTSSPVPGVTGSIKCRIDFLHVCSPESTQPSEPLQWDSLALHSCVTFLLLLIACQHPSAKPEDTSSQQPLLQKQRNCKSS